MLKAFYLKQEDIPAGAEEFYKEKGEKWVLQVEGLRTQDDVDTVKASLTAEREAHKATKARYRPFIDLVSGADDVDAAIGEVIASIDSIPELKAKAEHNDGADPSKVEELVEARVKSRLAPLQRENATLKENLEAATSEREALKTDIRTKSINEAIQKAAATSGVDAQSMEDVLMYAGRFEVDEEGKVIHTESGLDPMLWLNDMKAHRNWWGPTQGAGANGGQQGGQDSGTNPWAEAAWNQTNQAKFIEKYGIEKATAMAKRAGLSSPYASAPAKK